MTNFFESTKKIDNILDRQPIKGKDRKTFLNMIEADEALSQYFFKKVDDINWFKLLTDLGTFVPDKNPIPVESKEQKGYFTIPFWPVLIYLEKISQKHSDVGYSKVASGLMEIIRDVTRPKTGEKVDNYRTWHAFVKIMANLPTDVINMDDIDLIRDWLESKFDSTLVGSEIGKSLVTKFAQSEKPENWKKAAKIIDIMTEIKQVPSPTKIDSDSKPISEPELRIKSFWMKELFKKNAQLLGDRCGKKVVHSLTNRLSEFLATSHNDDQYSYVWRAAIEDHEQNAGEDRPGHVLIEALRDVLISYAASQDASTELKELIASKWNTLKRIAVYAINVNFEKYKNLFWEILSPSLFESNVRHEVYELLKKRFEIFSDKQKGEVVSLINELTRGWREDVNKDEMNAYLRAEWLTAIAGKGYAKADSLLETCKQTLKHPFKPEHPEFISYITSGGFSEKSPISATDLLGMDSVKAIVAYINEFKEKNQWGEPSCEGLGESLKAAVKTKPDFFINDLSEFLKCKFPYHYFVIDAFRDLSREKKILDWKKILTFSKELAGLSELWTEDDKEKDRYVRKNWIPTAIAELIESGVKEDDSAFDEALLPQASEVLNIILRKQPPGKLGNEREGFVNWAINTPRGRTLEAFLFYALRCIRIGEKKGSDEKEAEWKKLEPVLNYELKEALNGKYEFSTLAGRWLPNLYYMNKEWVEHNFAQIFPNQNPNLESNWRAALDGYSHIGTVYSVLYNLLKKNGDLDKVLDGIEHKQIRERIIDNIAISYLRGQESLDHRSLFAKILHGWKTEDISDVIGLFWQHRDVKFEKEEERISFCEKAMGFWRHCFNKIKGNEETYPEILSDLNQLTVFLDKIDAESKTWLLQSTPYVEKRYHASFFLEYLDALADVSPKEVGEIFVAMLESTIPIFKEENISSIVQKLYSHKQKELANQICDKYGRAGHEFLRPIYEKYN